MNKAERVKLALTERDKARAEIYLEILGYLNKKKHGQWFQRLIDCGPLGIMRLYVGGGGRWEVDWYDGAERWNGSALVKGA